MHYARKAGILHADIPLDDLVDRRFIPQRIEPARIGRVLE